MRKWQCLMLALALGLGLAGCQKQEAAAGPPGALPTGFSDEVLALLPEDWQWLPDWQQAEDLPRLLLLYDGACVEPLLCNHSWAQRLNDDEMRQYVACGASPLELQAEMPHLAHPQTEEAGRVQLIWQAQPTSFRAVAYDYTWWEKRQGLDLGFTLEDMPKSQMSPPDNTLTLFLDRGSTAYIMDTERGCYAEEIPPGSYLYVVWAEWQTEAEAEPGPGGYAEWTFFVE